MFFFLPPCQILNMILRQLSESLILIVFVMIGATFKLVTRVGLSTVIFGTLKEGILQIDSSTITIVSATETSSKMASTLFSKMVLKTCFFPVEKLKLLCSLDHMILFKFHQHVVHF